MSKFEVGDIIRLKNQPYPYVIGGIVVDIFIHRPLDAAAVRAVKFYDFELQRICVDVASDYQKL